jgi:hypothetical protein
MKSHSSLIGIIINYGFKKFIRSALALIFKSEAEPARVEHLLGAFF